MNDSTKRTGCTENAGAKGAEQQRIISQLQAAMLQAEAIEPSSDSSWKASPVVTGSPLDRLFAVGGLRRATLVEWLSCGAGSGASTLAFSVAQAAGASGGAIVVMDRRQLFYPPAAAGLGFDLQQLIVIRPSTEADDIWALDQAARCPSVAAVLWWGERLDGRHFRRLQLACEASGSLGLLVRPHTVRGEPSWAHVRLLIQNFAQPVVQQAYSGRRVRVELLKCRSAAAGASVELEIDDETGKISEAVPLHLVTRRTSRRPA